MEIPLPNPVDVGPRNLFDRQGVANLKRLSRAETPEALTAVAQQFETLFVGMMLKSMREASLGEDALFGSSAQQTYQGMFDQQLALNTADRGVLGISKLMLQQLQHQSSTEPESRSAHELKLNRPGQASPGVSRVSEKTSVLSTEVNPEVNQALTALSSAALDQTQDPGQANGIQAPLVTPPLAKNFVHSTSTMELISLRAKGAERSHESSLERPTMAGAEVKPGLEVKQPNAAEFLQQIWPLAVATGRRIGVAPEAIAGQAVLESGWGQKTISSGNDQSSHNIFGIKAGPDWAGDSVTVSTLEYDQGVAIRQQAKFRAYDSHAEAFSDYADFLQNRPWYQAALAQGDNIAAFAEGLQQAGYATDPQYANKITRLAEQIKTAGDGRLVFIR